MICGSISESAVSCVVCSVSCVLCPEWCVVSVLSERERIEVREMEEIFKRGVLTLEGLENVRIFIGKIEEEEEEWEPMGPTPMPAISTIRSWDFKLLRRYKPFYAPFCDFCCLCTFGKCDLTGNKKGACGIRMDAQQGRIVLLACIIGCSAHCGHEDTCFTNY